MILSLKPSDVNSFTSILLSCLLCSLLAVDGPLLLLPQPAARSVSPIAAAMISVVRIIVLSMLYPLADVAEERACQSSPLMLCFCLLCLFLSYITFLWKLFAKIVYLY